MSSGERLFILQKNEKLDIFAEEVKRKYTGKAGKNFFKKHFNTLTCDNFKRCYDRGVMTPTAIHELAAYLKVKENDLQGSAVPRKKSGKKPVETEGQISLNFETKKEISAQEISKKTGALVGELAELWSFAIAQKFFM